MEMTIIDRLCSIEEKMHDENAKSAMSFDRIEIAASDINVLEKELGLTPVQVVFLTAIIRKNPESGIAGQSLAHSLGLNYLRFLGFSKELEDLRSKGYIRIDKKRNITMPRDVLDTLIENKPVEPEPMTGLSSNDLLIRIKRAFDLRIEDQCTTKEMLDDLNYLMELNPEVSVAKAILRIMADVPQNEIAILYGLIYLYYFNDDEMVGWRRLEIFLTDKEFTHLKSDCKLERLSLQKKGVIVYAERNSVVEKDCFKLSDEVKEELFADVGGVKKQKKVTASRKLEASEIEPKTLFYNRNEDRQVFQLKQMLNGKRFDEIRSKMKAKGLRSGFTCLFYGEPGTGKTETVYQIARECGRAIYIVDVSQIKSCWVGESEKNIKKVFDNYREAINNSGTIPILLFNEADAIFGIRREGAEAVVGSLPLRLC